VRTFDRKRAEPSTLTERLAGACVRHRPACATRVRLPRFSRIRTSESPFDFFTQRDRRPYEERQGAQDPADRELGGCPAQPPAREGIARLLQSGWEAPDALATARATLGRLSTSWASAHPVARLPPLVCIAARDGGHASSSGARVARPLHHLDDDALLASRARGRERISIRARREKLRQPDGNGGGCLTQACVIMDGNVRPYVDEFRTALAPCAAA
jgi:hypothetical protein